MIQQEARQEWHPVGSALVENAVMRILRELDHNKSIVCLTIRTYDCQEQARLYHATDDWELFYQKMGSFDLLGR